MSQAPCPRFTPAQSKATPVPCGFPRQKGLDRPHFRDSGVRRAAKVARAGVRHIKMARRSSTSKGGSERPARQGNMGSLATRALEHLDSQRISSAVRDRGPGSRGRSGLVGKGRAFVPSDRSTGRVVGPEKGRRRGLRLRALNTRRATRRKAPCLPRGPCRAPTGHRFPAALNSKGETRFQPAP